MQQLNLMTTDEANAQKVFADYFRDCDVFMCIGTDKVFCDSLGPKVGTLLNLSMQKPIYVYGVEGKCVTAQNLLHCYNFVKTLHNDRKIAVIDAGVGDVEQIGCVQLYDGGLQPGAATNKNLPSIGDVALVGIVGEKGLGDFYTTNTAKLRLVEKMATAISENICKSVVFKQD